jgi:hypothetical protein
MGADVVDKLTDEKILMTWRVDMTAAEEMLST